MKNPKFLSVITENKSETWFYFLYTLHTHTPSKMV